MVTNSKVYILILSEIFMKRQLYDLTDPAMFMFVDRIGKVLKEEGIPHNVVGGLAVQSYMLDMFSKKYNCSINDLVKNPDFRVQDYVRSTDDIDLALGIDGDDATKINKITRFLPKLDFEDIDPNEEAIIALKLLRKGAYRSTFLVVNDGVTSDENIIAMNISRGQEGDLHKLSHIWYNAFLENSQRLSLQYNDKHSTSVQVPKLEHLLSNKIAASRAKDLMDCSNLVTLLKDRKVQLDFEEMGRVLMPVYQDNFQSFLSNNYPDVSLESLGLVKY